MDHSEQSEETSPSHQDHAHASPTAEKPGREQEEMEAAARNGHRDHGGHGGHDHHAMMVEDFKRRFWVSLALTVPILVLSPMIQGFLGIGEALRFTGDLYVLLRDFVARLLLPRMAVPEGHLRGAC